jgi:hypothetical protein
MKKFTWLTSFCRASHSGAAQNVAASLIMARLSCHAGHMGLASGRTTPLSVAQHTHMRHRCAWRVTLGCITHASISWLLR